MKNETWSGLLLCSGRCSPPTSWRSWRRPSRRLITPTCTPGRCWPWRRSCPRTGYRWGSRSGDINLTNQQSGELIRGTSVMRKPWIIQIRDRFPVRGKHQRKIKFSQLKKKEVFFSNCFYYWFNEFIWRGCLVFNIWALIWSELCSVLLILLRNAVNMWNRVVFISLCNTLFICLPAQVLGTTSDLCTSCFISRCGFRTGGPSGVSVRSAGVAAASWRSTVCTAPWCDTPSRCPSPSSTLPRTAWWDRAPPGCSVSRMHVSATRAPQQHQYTPISDQ